MPRNPPTNDHGRDTTFLVDQNIIDVANLVIGRIIDILLVKIRHRGAGWQPSEDLSGPSGRRRRLLGEGRRTDRHCEQGVAEMIVFMFGDPSLLEGIADGILSASHRVLYLACRLLCGAFGLSLGITSHLANG